MITVDRLLTDLNREGSSVEILSDGRYLLRAYRGKSIKPAAKMTLTSASLEALIRLIEADDPQVLFPDRDLETAAYFLLLAGLEEEVTRYDGKISALHILDDGIRGIPSADFIKSSALASNQNPGDHAWQSHAADT